MGRGTIVNCYVCGKPFKIDGKHDLYCEDCRPAALQAEKDWMDNMDREGAMKLCCAIMKTISTDYKRIVKKWHREKNADKKRDLFRQLQHESKNFKSEYIQNIAGYLDCRVIQKELNKVAFEEIKEEDERKKKKIGKFTRDGKLVGVYPNANQAGISVDTSGVSVMYCVKVEWKHCKGYIFRYI